MAPKFDSRAARGRGAVALAVGALAAVAMAVAAPWARAQQPPAPQRAPQQSQAPQQRPAAPQTRPAQSAPAPTQAATSQDAWVKICEPVPGAEDKRVCLTHHERIDGNTGIVVVSAAVRKIEGQDSEHLLVTVPLGTVLPNGALLRVDEGKPFPLPFVFCHIGGCLAEQEATKEVIDSLKKGGKLGILVVQAASRKPLVYEIPLTGFTKALQGAPVDSVQYRESRQQLLMAIRERQIELARKAAEAAEGREGQPGQQPPAQAR